MCVSHLIAEGQFVTVSCAFLRIFFLRRERGVGNELRVKLPFSEHRKGGGGREDLFLAGEPSVLDEEGNEKKKS